MAATQSGSNLELDPKYDRFDFPTKSIEAREGHPGYLTAAQQAQIHQLRLMLESEGFTGQLDSLTLLRFLRARKFDVPAAKKMLVESDQWRNHMTILEIEDKVTMGQQRLLSLSDDPFTNPPEQPLKLDEIVRTWDKDGSFKKRLSKHYTQFYHKTDKDGRPCYFEKLGGIKFNELRKDGFTNDQMILNLAVEYEKMVDSRLPACSRRAGRLVETSCSVLDANQISFLDTEAIRSYIRQTSAMSNSNYPERLGKMFVINVPWSLTWLWGIIQKFLDPVTASKIHVLGYKYKAELLKQIPEENLPAMFGGKCNCEGGCELSDEGPWQEDEWKQPARREEEPSDATIENKPADIVTGDAAAVVEGEETKVAA